MHVTPPAESMPAPIPTMTEVAPEAAAPAAATPVSARLAAMPRSRRMLLLAAAGVAVVAGGTYFEVLKSSQVAVVSSAEASMPVGRMADGSFRLTDAEAKLLRIEPVVTRDFRPERVAEGRISYNEDRATPIYPPYTGRVVRVVAQPGQAVQAGDILFELETTDLTQATNDLLTASDAVAKARNQVELTRRNDQRQRDLFAARAAARRDMEQAAADLANAQSDLRTTESSLAAARDKLRVLGRDADAIAEIERTRRVNAVVAVRAPLPGTVVQRRIGPGQWLNAGGADPVFTIADLSQMWLVAAVRELDAPMVRTGQEVQVMVNALPDRVFPARIESVANALDPQTRRLPVRASVQDPEHVLKPEMFAAFRISVGSSAQSVAVPAAALIHRGAETSVWEALDDTRFIMRRVRTGLRMGEQVQVLEGLEPQARVVSGGALFIDRAATAD